MLAYSTSDAVHRVYVRQDTTCVYDVHSTSITARDRAGARLDCPRDHGKKIITGHFLLSSGPFASCPLEREPPSPLAFRRYILLTPEGAQCLATWKQSTDFPARLELTPVSCYPMTAVADSYPHLISLYLPLFLWPFGVGEINLLSGPSPLHDSTYFYQI